MTEEESLAGPVDALLESLWSPGSESNPKAQVFALLDGARFPDLQSHLRRSKLDHQCLYRGKLSPRLARVAPYLVSLGRRSAGTRDLLAATWGPMQDPRSKGGRGIFLRSEALLQELRRHLSRLLQVEDPAGRSFFLRFYDPSVLPVFLPICTQEELVFLFGPVESFLMEMPGGVGLLRYSCLEGEQGVELLEEKILLGSEGPSSEGRRIGGLLRGPDPGRQGDRPLRLRQPQWDVLGNSARRRYEDRALEVLARCWPRTCHSRGEESMRALIRRSLVRAKEHGLTGRREAMHFLNLQLSLGEDFDGKSWAQEVLAKDRLAGPVKMSLLLPKARRALAAETGR